MNSFDIEFRQRVSKIPFHGLGLSVDVYSPDVFDLTEQLEEQALSYGYLENACSPSNSKNRHYRMDI